MKAPLHALGRVWRYARAAAQILRRPMRTRAPLVHAQIEPTSRCNLDCPMCLRKEVFGAGQHMSFETFRHVFGELRPLHLTMNGQGETMMNPDIFRMIEHAESNGARVNLTTNGNYLHRFHRQVLDCGLTLLSVSLDTVDREAYIQVRSLDLLEQTLAGLRLFAGEKRRRGAARPELRLSSVMMERTLDGAEAFLEQARELGVSTVLFQPMALFGRWENATLMGRYADRDVYRRKVEELRDHARAGAIETNLDQVLKDFAIVVQCYDRGRSPEDALSKGCPFPWFSTYVRADGKVLACCVRSYAQEFLGDLTQEGMDAIWNNASYQDLRRAFRHGRTLPYNECVGCAPPRLSEMAPKMRYTPGFMRLTD